MTLHLTCACEYTATFHGPTPSNARQSARQSGWALPVGSQPAQCLRCRVRHVVPVPVVI